MRIAILTWESLHSISVGGVAVHTTELAAALERKGHEVHVFTRMRWEGDWQYDKIHGVHYHRVPYRGSNDFIDDINQMCRAFVDSVFHTENYMGAHFDIVHAHDWMSSNAMVWIKQGRGRKAILTIHSTEYGRCGNNFYGGPSRELWTMNVMAPIMQTRLYRLPNVKNELAWIYNLPIGKPCNTNGISLTSLMVLSILDLSRKIWYRSHGSNYPVCGKNDFQKGPDLLVSAIPYVLRYYPNAKFIFSGNGDMRAHVENLARSLGVAYACRFYGVFPEVNLSIFTRRATVLLFPAEMNLSVLLYWKPGHRENQ